jgi:hypothetical protein
LRKIVFNENETYSHIADFWILSRLPGWFKGYAQAGSRHDLNHSRSSENRGRLTFPLQAGELSKMEGLPEQLKKLSGPTFNSIP